MRHDPDLHKPIARDARIDRLFALHHQQTAQAQFAAADPGPERLPPDVVLLLRDRATASFRSE